MAKVARAKKTPWSLVEDFVQRHGIVLEVRTSGSNLLWIDMVLVPKELRGKGLGTKVVKLVEDAARAEGIKTVLLYAADTDGNGRSGPFWESLGYGYDESDNEDEDAEENWYMRKNL